MVLSGTNTIHATPPSLTPHVFRDGRDTRQSSQIQLTASGEEEEGGADFGSRELGIDGDRRRLRQDFFLLASPAGEYQLIDESVDRRSIEIERPARLLRQGGGSRLSDPFGPGDVGQIFVAVAQSRRLWMATGRVKFRVKG